MMFYLEPTRDGGAGTGPETPARSTSPAAERLGRRRRGRGEREGERGVQPRKMERAGREGEGRRWGVSELSAAAVSGQRGGRGSC